LKALLASINNAWVT